MSEREPDFEFDFFDEPQTQEAPSRDRSLRRPLGGRNGGRGPRRPMRPVRPAAGFTPLLRLVGLIAFAILIVVLLVLWAQSCQRDKQEDAYRDYITDTGAIGEESQRIGRRLSDVLTTQEITIERAGALDPPGPLRNEHENMIQALEFRESGLAGLAAVFRRTAGTEDAAAAASDLASQANRLIASDVIWEDQFVEPAKTELRREGVAGVDVRDSTFVQTPDLSSQETMTRIWQRINNVGGTDTGGTGAGLHGTNLEGVTVRPGGAQLSASAENTVEATTDLAFEVAVTNSGDNQEVQIEVTLTIVQPPNNVVKKQTIDLIDPGETKTVTFRDFPSIDFGEPRTLRVDVAPVPNESNPDNNSAEYRVTFSVPE